MVKFFFPSIISQITGEKQTNITATTLGEALNTLVEKYGDSFKKVIFNESKEVHRYYRFFINGKIITSYNQMEITLKNDDIINILLIIAGG